MAGSLLQTAHLIASDPTRNVKPCVLSASHQQSLAWRISGVLAGNLIYKNQVSPHYGEQEEGGGGGGGTLPLDELYQIR